jgi:bacillithiol system protein YtxJ
METPLRFIYKHSPTCSLSALAAEQVTQFQSQRPTCPVQWLDVFAERGECQRIEQETGVRHESPQALLFDGARVVWHASHRRVTAEAMAAALDAHAAASTSS